MSDDIDWDDVLGKRPSLDDDDDDDDAGHGIIVPFDSNRCPSSTANDPDLLRAIVQEAILTAMRPLQQQVDSMEEKYAMQNASSSDASDELRRSDRIAKKARTDGK